MMVHHFVTVDRGDRHRSNAADVLEHCRRCQEIPSPLKVLALFFCFHSLLLILAHPLMLWFVFLRTGAKHRRHAHLQWTVMRTERAAVDRRPRTCIRAIIIDVVHAPIPDQRRRTRPPCQRRPLHLCRPGSATVSTSGNIAGPFYLASTARNR
jgi:hypothetical protein